VGDELIWILIGMYNVVGKNKDIGEEREIEEMKREGEEGNDRGIGFSVSI
jgi:hypothetical protein